MPAIDQIVALSCQLSNGATNKFVKATIRGPDGTSLTTKSLAHAGLGKYVDDSYLMPDLDFIDVTYEVYNDVGLATLSTTYTKGTDTFWKEGGASSGGGSGSGGDFIKVTIKEVDQISFVLED